MDVWAEVADGRRRLADEIDQLEPDALDATSWCSGWRLRDVLGHLVYLAEATQWSVLHDVIRLGPSPDRALDRRARALGDQRVEELTHRLRAAATGQFHVLGSPAVVALGEVLVHGVDVLAPVGRGINADPSVVTPILRVYRRVHRFAFHGTSFGSVTLVPTDGDIRLGKGPEVRGRSIDLLLLLANRSQVVPRLSGPGIDQLNIR